MVRIILLLVSLTFLFFGCIYSIPNTPVNKETNSIISDLNSTNHSTDQDFFLRGSNFSISNEGNIYFVDPRNRSIVRKANLENYKSIEKFIDLKEWIRSKESSDFKIDDLWVDHQGKLILAESTAGKILRVSKDARKLENLTDSYDGYRLSKIHGLNGTKDGKIFIGSPNSATIYEFDTNLGKLSVLNENLVRPKDFAMNAAGNRLIVAESNPNRILVYDINSPEIMKKSWNLIQFYKQRPISLDILDSNSNYIAVLINRGQQLKIFDLLKGELVDQIDFSFLCFRVRAHSEWIYLQTRNGIIRKQIPFTVN